MWLIKHTKSGQCFYLFGEKIKYTIGRVGADLVLSDDSSISRTHAFLHVQKTAAEQLELEDAGSKYGTYHNVDKDSKACMNKGDRIALKHGDHIRFGRLESIWQVTHMPLICMTSTLSESVRKQLATYLSKLGVRILQQWNASCTHLIMTEITITVKLLHALLEHIPIVTCDYWRDLLSAVRQNQTTLPLPAEYAPPRSESLKLVPLNLGSMPERRRLFVGITFVFMNRKHFDMYTPIVEKAGGSSRDLKSGVVKSFLLKSKVVVVQYVPTTQSQSSQTINSIEEYLETHSRRIIPEYEIGLAILHCSTVKYCNPSHNVINDIMPSTLTAVESVPESKNFVENTRPPSGATYSSTDVFVPETEINQAVQPNYAISDRFEMEETEVNPSIGSQSKRKRTVKCTPIDDSDNEDENLFQFAKRTRQERQEQQQTAAVCSEASKAPSTTPKTARMKPLPIQINHTKTKTVSTKGFLAKPKTNSDINKTVSTATNEEAHSQQQTTRKRPRIAVLTDDDDDLFSFAGPSTSMGAKKMCVNDMNDNKAEDEGLFGFTSPPKDTAARVVIENENDDELAATQEFIPKVKQQVSALPKPKPRPQKVSTAGWLSCGMYNMNLKAETPSASPKKEDVDDANVKTEEPLFKGGFEVCAVDISIRVRDTISQLSLCGDKSSHSTSTVDAANTATCRNFKTFVKKPTLHPQRKVIPTIAMPAVQ